MSHLIPNLDTIFYFYTPKVYTYFFNFEETDLYVVYPLSEECEPDIYLLREYPIYYQNIYIDEDGNMYAS